MEKRYDVFISYSSQDQKIVEGICGYLERKGYRCFVAYRDIPHGVVWATAITDALDASKMVVVVFSNAFNVSPQTDREIELASENHIPILTYRLADEKMTGAKKYYLKNLNWIDAFPNPENYFGQLYESVVKLIGFSAMEMEHATQKEAGCLAQEVAERQMNIQKQRQKEQVLKKTSTPKRKGKKALWIALAATVAVLALLLFLLWPKNVESVDDSDTETFQACRNIDDYRKYITDFGTEAMHYAEAQSIIDQYVADSIKIKWIQDSLALSQTRRQAGKKEDAAYKKCTSIEECEYYLTTYPNGRYVVEVKAKKAELETQKVNNNGTVISYDYQYVDLGLPSGTLWATCNVGAAKPEEYGGYYAWGETRTKNIYNWEAYKYSNGNYNKLTKYCNKPDYGNNGFTDNLTTLQTSDDVATANWGSGWYVPTKAQWEELKNNTTFIWTTNNGVEGGLFAAKNGQSVFLPATGSCWDNEHYSAKSLGYYWSRSLSTNGAYYAWSFYFNSGDCGITCSYRNGGFSVRPVRSVR